MLFYATRTTLNKFLTISPQPIYFLTKLTYLPSVQYHKNVEDLIKNPKNVGFLNKQRIVLKKNIISLGSLDKKSSNVGTGIVGSPQCGDVMKLQLEISEDGEIIEKAVFKTFGCGSAIASSSYATEQLKGKTLNEAKQFKNSEIVDHLKLPPVKIHCSVLAEQSIKKAIEDYEKKQKLKKQAK